MSDENFFAQVKELLDKGFPVHMMIDAVTIGSETYQLSDWHECIITKTDGIYFFGAFTDDNRETHFPINHGRWMTPAEEAKRKMVNPVVVEHTVDHTINFGVEPVTAT